MSAPRLTKKKLFELITEEVLLDGRIDEVEHLLLRRVASFLKLSKDVARSILLRAKKQFEEGKLGHERSLDGSTLYRKALKVAAADGKADKLEAIMLQGLRSVLSISATEHKEAIKELRARKTQEKRVKFVPPTCLLNPFQGIKSRRSHPELWLNVSRALGCKPLLHNVVDMFKSKSARKRSLVSDYLWLSMAHCVRMGFTDELAIVVEALGQHGGAHSLLTDAMEMSVDKTDGRHRLLSALATRVPVTMDQKSSALTPRLELESKRFDLEKEALNLAAKESFSCSASEAAAVVISEPKFYPRPLIMIKNHCPSDGLLNLVIRCENDNASLTLGQSTLAGHFSAGKLKSALEKSDGAYDLFFLDGLELPWQVHFFVGSLDPTGLVQLTEEALSQGDVGKSTSLLSQAIEECPWQSRALLARAKLHLQITGNFDNARSDAQSALERQPFDSGASALLGTLAMREERFNEALDYYERAIALEPTNENYLRTLVKLSAKLRDEDLVYWLAALRARVGEEETVALAQWANVAENAMKDYQRTLCDPIHRLRQETPSGNVSKTRIP